MKYRRLGTTDVEVSLIGLGTMTWGQQNTEAEAHAQLDAAVDHGITLIDAAEMYPVPPRAETQGATETFIGSWLAGRARRDDVVIASKIVGPADFPWIRDGKTRFTREHLVAAVDGSLERLQTDYIDLYQLHWPDRNTNFFGSLEYHHDPDEEATPLEETFAVLAELVASGKIRAVGLSNETPWGVMKAVSLAEQQGLPRVVSVQNPYNLLNRSFEVGLAEVAIRERVGLLAYSPLAMGVLTGKYEGGRTFPPGARLTLFQRFQRYQTPAAMAASEAYVALAREHGVDPGQLALAWVNHQPFTTSNLIGATSMDQLTSNIASLEVELTTELREGIEAIHSEHPNPAP